MCGIIFSIVIFRVGLRRRNRFQRDTSGEPTIRWAAAIKSFGTRTRTNRNTMVNPSAPPRNMAQDSPTALRVFVHHTSSREHDDNFGSTWRGSMTKPAVDGDNDGSSSLAV